MRGRILAQHGNKDHKSSRQGKKKKGESPVANRYRRGPPWTETAKVCRFFTGISTYSKATSGLPADSNLKSTALRHFISQCCLFSMTKAQCALPKALLSLIEHSILALWQPPHPLSWQGLTDLTRCCREETGQIHPQRESCSLHREGSKNERDRTAP